MKLFHKTTTGKPKDDRMIVYWNYSGVTRSRSHLSDRVNVIDHRAHSESPLVEASILMVVDCSRITMVPLSDHNWALNGPVSPRTI